MTMKKLILCIPILLCLQANSQQPHSHELGRKIDFPDIPGYKTLKFDFHQHSVFSDGSVWPDIRVEEAIRDGLDAISLTEHLEYQPHKEDIPHPDRNRAYNLALNYAKDQGLLIANGSEITRSMPPGHTNTIFIADANKLLIEDSIEVFREAKNQGGFTFWNHPNWIAQVKDGMVKLTDMHKKLIAEGLLHGIEVVNDLTYSAEALQIALDNNLTIMGTSDIHGLVDWQYEINQGGHRPITLVFSKEKSLESIKEGLKNQRTVVWFNNLLIGKSEFIVPLIQQSLSIKRANYPGKYDVLSVVIENNSDAEYFLENQSGFTFHSDQDLITIAPHTTKILEIKTKERIETLDIKFKVLNAITAPGVHPEITLEIKVE